MSYTVIIPSCRSFQSIKPLLESLKIQTFLPDRIVIIRDLPSSQLFSHEYNSSISSLFQSIDVQIDTVDIESTNDFQCGKGVSCVRNFGILLVKTPFLMTVDDDNVLQPTTCEKLFSFFQEDDQKNHTKSILVPVQLRDNSSEAMTCVADGFNFALCRPRWLSSKRSSDRYQNITLASSNCLVGPTQVFQDFPFPEDVPFVYEDLIMTAQVSKSGIQLLYDTQTSISHYHGQRTTLQSLYLDTPERCFYKAKHRILLVHTLAIHRYDYVIFYGFGLWGHSAWLLLHILLFAPWKQKGKCILSLFRGTLSAIKKLCFG